MVKLSQFRVVENFYDVLAQKKKNNNKKKKTSHFFRFAKPLQANWVTIGFTTLTNFNGFHINTAGRGHQKTFVTSANASPMDDGERATS